MQLFQTAAQTKIGLKHEEKEALAIQEEAYNYANWGKGGGAEITRNSIFA